MPTGGSVNGGARHGARKPASKRKPAGKRKPATKKPKSKTSTKSAPLSGKTVVQLRKMAKRSGAKQTNRDGSTKNKSQLMASIRASRK